MARCLNYDLFVSYSVENEAEVSDLCGKLESKGFKLLFDTNETRDLNRIKKIAIDNSLLFMCCVSNEYCDSSIALKEFNYAIETEKEVLYVLFDKLNQTKEIIKKIKKIASNFALQRYYKQIQLHDKLHCNYIDIDSIAKMIRYYKKVQILLGTK